MATELRPGVFTATFAKVVTEADTRSRLALEPLALAVERRTKDQLRTTSHRYGTPTPAVSGGPPSLISGNLARSITHSPISKGAAGWETKVGTGVGFFPTYQGVTGTVAGRTPANKYGLYLETGLRNGARYPFLTVGFRLAIVADAPKIYTAAYGANWRRVA